MNDLPDIHFPDDFKPEGQPSDYDKMLLSLSINHTKLSEAQAQLIQRLMTEIARVHLRLAKLEEKVNDQGK